MWFSVACLVVWGCDQLPLHGTSQDTPCICLKAATPKGSLMKDFDENAPHSLLFIVAIARMSAQLMDITLCKTILKRKK